MAIKRITVQESEALITEIIKECARFGEEGLIDPAKGRAACILAEAIFTAVDNHRAANRKPRPPKRVTPNA